MIEKKREMLRDKRQKTERKINKTEPSFKPIQENGNKRIVDQP